MTISNGKLVVEMQGMDKVWALKSLLTIPLSPVRGATTDPGITRERSGWRGPGTYIPGVVTAGTFHHDGERIFWDVHDGANAIVIELGTRPTGD